MELPSARAISNALSRETEERRDGDNTILVMQMGQFIDHDITHTPNHAIQCCGRNGAFPRTFDAEKCSPIRMFKNDPFWKGKKTCMNFARSLSSPGLKCELSTREQLNQITHWLDGSNIYGSTLEEAMYLRQAAPLSLVEDCRGFALIGRMLLTPALLGHKDTAQGTQSTPFRTFRCVFMAYGCL